MTFVLLDRPLTWTQVAQVADGAALVLSEAAQARITIARSIVESIVSRNIKAYGVNTGVGALSDVVIPMEQLGVLSRNILMSHAAGVGAPLPEAEVRAIMTSTVNLFALGYSGVRLGVVEHLVAFLNGHCSPITPRQGSVGYLSHRAHIGLALIGFGRVIWNGEGMAASDALARLQLEPLRLEAKEGLSLVNGTACASGLGCLAVSRAFKLLAWANAIAAMTFEAQGGQLAAFDPAIAALHHSPGLRTVAASLKAWLAGSELLAAASGRRVQDALSLRSIPQVHGAVADACGEAARVVERELHSATDNPTVYGTPDAPRIASHAHAVGAALGLAMDHLGVAIAELGVISERRLDRMVNPLVSGAPPFLARASGVASGFMIAQYSAMSLVAENRRLTAPSSLDGGVTSGLQEDMLCHATPGALKALDIIRNTEAILAIELLAACQSQDLLESRAAPAPGIARLHAAVRGHIPIYEDDRPLGDDIATATSILRDLDPSDFAELN